MFAPTTLCQVDHGKPKTDTVNNPSSDELVDWLRQISSWSNVHPTHSPITVGLDLTETQADSDVPTSGAPPSPAPSRTRKFANPLRRPLHSPPLRMHTVDRAHYHCSSGRAALDAMVRTEFLNIFTPAELAAHREARDGAGWPLVDHMRGKVHISP